jgi:hexosaminidase
MSIVFDPAARLNDLVPSPQTVERHPGEFILSGVVTVWSDYVPAARLLKRLLGAASEVTFTDVKDPAAAQIRLYLMPGADLAAEGYELDVAPNAVTIVARDNRGLVWAIQTLRQLFPPDIYAPHPGAEVVWRVPTCRIVDEPRHPWRGILLDVARWYRPVPFLYRFIELASLHKINVLHLHLTDDQGWRFEVKKYPRLTSIGAWRAESRIGHWRDGPLDGMAHGGFYTQEELQGLVSFAEALGVTIVPEIDLPGHTKAAIAAYPHLGNHPDRQLEVETGWGVIEEVLNPDESTLRFFYDVFDELLDIFPSLYIHIGGDECPRTEWEQSENLDQVLHDRELESVEEIEPWILGRVSSYLRARGRIPIGWDEILDGSNPTETTPVMSWRGESGGATALELGRDVVMAPNTYLYFDQYQSAAIDSEPIAADGVIELEKVFEYAPEAALPIDHAPGQLLGVECALWGEHLPDNASVDYMMFPRTPAYADVAWGHRAENDFGRYRTMLARHEDRLAGFGVPRKLSEQTDNALTSKA